MKKQILLLLVVFLVGTTSNALAQLNWGVRAGMATSTRSGEAKIFVAEEYGSINGMDIGIIGDYQINSLFSIQTELNFIQKGRSAELETIQPINATAVLPLKISYEYQNFNQIEIPILAKFHFGDKIKYNILAGPFVTAPLTASQKSTYTLGDGNPVEREGDIKFEGAPDDHNPLDPTKQEDYMDPEEYNGIDFGLYIGAGIGTAVGPGTLFLNVKYGIGLSDLHKEQYFKAKGLAGYPDDYVAFKSTTLSFTISYMF